MHAPQSANRLIEFHAGALDTTVVMLRETAPPLLADELHKMLVGIPDFFNGEAAILDFSELGNEPEQIDWPGLLSLWRRYRLQPIGVRGLPQRLASSARRLGLTVLDNTPVHQASPQQCAPPDPPTAAAEPETADSSQAIATVFVDRQVRSGQQIYAKDGDLVLLDGMSSGAEVIADGSIHCYGPLRGRALAGAQGNDQARIITSCFGPEIIAIAGVYMTFEQGIPTRLAGKPVQVLLLDQRGEQTMQIEPLALY